jgi:hypothetical protein
MADTANPTFVCARKRGGIGAKLPLQPTERTTMGILSNIFHKIFPGSTPDAAPAAATPTATAAATPAAAAPVPAAAAPAAAPAQTTSSAAAPQVDVEAILTTMQQQNSQQLNWRTSIVDLLKLLNLDSSLTARKELADELHYAGDRNDSASMNIWLHRQVMNKLAENGGKVPADLKD